MMRGRGSLEAIVCVVFGFEGRWDGREGVEVEDWPSG